MGAVSLMCLGMCVDVVFLETSCLMAVTDAVFFVVFIALPQSSKVVDFGSKIIRAASCAELDQNTSSRNLSRTDTDRTSNSKWRFDVERELLVTCCIYISIILLDNNGESNVTFIGYLDYGLFIYCVIYLSFEVMRYMHKY